jgi:hypothetical protein
MLQQTFNITLSIFPSPNKEDAIVIVDYTSEGKEKKATMLLTTEKITSFKSKLALAIYVIENSL